MRFAIRTALLTLLVPAMCHAQFGPQSSLYIEGPITVQLADLDADSDNDLLVGTRGGPMVFTNPDGLGAFSVPEPQISTEHVVCLAVDVNGDDRSDLVASKKQQFIGIDVFIRNGSGYEAPVNISSTINADIIRAADLDGDSDMDLALVLSNGDIVVSYNTDGAGTFGAFQTVAPNWGAHTLQFADIDEDNDRDLVWSYFPTSSINWSENIGGSFGPVQTFCAYGAGGVYDMDGDGIFDALYSNTGTGAIEWRSRHGGVLTSAQAVAIPWGQVDILSAEDLDGDGDLDAFWSSTVVDHQGWAENTNGLGAFGAVQIISSQVAAMSALATGDMDGDGDQDLFHLSTSANSVLWNENLAVAGAAIVGRVFNDRNGDGIFNGNDHGVEGALVEVPGSYGALTNHSGMYRIDAPAGSYTVELAGMPQWSSTTSPSLSVTVPNGGSAQGVDFGVEAGTPTFNVLPMIASAETRCGYWVNYWIAATNTGNQIADLTLALALDDLSSIGDASPLADSIINDTAYWTILSVAPSQTRVIPLSAMMADVSHMGDTLHDHLRATLSTAGIPKATHTVDQYPILVSSYDPNDKVVMPAGQGEEHITAMDEKLTYTIRFQNTGNATALDVVLADTIHPSLDMTSFEIRGTSHPCIVTLGPGHIVHFRFDGIMLPDSTTNFLGSQGFVRFSFSPFSGLPEGEVIENTAAIYFDNNPPVITNTAFNTLSYGLVGAEELPFKTEGFALFPNPAQLAVTLQVDAARDGAHQAFLYDATGRPVRFWMVRPGVMQDLPLGGLNDGMYTLRVLAMEGGYDRAQRLIIAR
ncbi:MAG: VCBS repeat-containing protein [Flavobacteriales bacterium]|nr:VCBS repeat-containing protein [Flavobacteriales bacterium]